LLFASLLKKPTLLCTIATWPKERKLLLASIDLDVSKDNLASSSAKDKFFILINIGYRRPKTVYQATSLFIRPADSIQIIVDELFSV
jgi:hypothetical protein